MRTLLALALALSPLLLGLMTPAFSAPLISAPLDCSMKSDPRPACFAARLEPVVKVTLVAYGTPMTSARLAQIEALFKTRFESSTENRIRVEIVDRGILDLASSERDLTEVRQAVRGDESRRTLDRLTRLWYYHHSDYLKLTNELHDVLRTVGMGPALAESDFVLALSGPQFEGLGYADGGMALVEEPMEIAWSTSDGGSTRWNTDEQLVDELLHEIGHLLGLQHASARCFDDAMSGAERAACCRTSPGANDVMSYCRDRSRVRGPYHYRYTSCSKEFLFGTTLPALLNGSARPFQPTACD